MAKCIISLTTINKKLEPHGTTYYVSFVIQYMAKPAPQHNAKLSKNDLWSDQFIKRTKIQLLNTYKFTHFYCKNLYNLLMDILLCFVE